ncbi:ABC transporter substrate-binding protein [Pusillimonas sp. T2]|uniref:TRAP transporter substrate-binding protein DctP n=1 Tax=Pusillimonas sp. T2 TaxID=1548123 RepID=UPI000B9CA668|nr:TRAP transporter substrate-binding protein DctP [Pusillimonas sp. T2]OXR48881.1 ABC transporter substrate-binding protein [Pusillimonas sp. T2]
MKFQLKKIVLGAVLGLAAVSAQSAEVTLKAVSVFNKDAFFFRQFNEFMNSVNAEGKGLVQIQFVGGPESMPPFEVGSALRSGVVDIANTTAVFHANLVPEGLALTVTDTPMAELRKNGGYELMDKIHREKANMVWLGRTTDGLKYHVYSNKKPDGNSFAGMKLRSVPVYRAFFQSLGAAPLQVPPGEVFTALERGVVDGYGWPSVGIFDLGWQEKTKYRVEPGFYNVEVSLFMNQDTWEKKLNNEQREFLKAQMAKIEANYAKDHELAVAEKKRQEEFGIEMVSVGNGDAFVKQANAEAWKAIDQASPKHAAELRAKFGGNK